MRLLFVDDSYKINRLRGGRVQWLGPMILSRTLKQEGFQVEAVGNDYEGIREELRKDIPTVVGFSMTTFFARPFIETNRKIKAEFQVPTICGGPHPTFFPELILNEPFDALCRGEGDEAVPEFMRCLRDGKPVKNLKNWWVRDGEEITRNELRPLAKDLDALPFPDRILYPPTPMSGANVITSRDCPFQCSYCFNHAYRKIYGNYKVRRRSVDNVIQELQETKEAFCRDGFPLHFVFVDDLFILSRDWTAEFCERYASEIGRPFACQVRANLVTEEIMGNLKRAGCHGVAMGVETGNEQLRRNVLKKHISNQDILKASAIIRDSGIRLGTYNMIGIPTGTFENDLETLKINMESKPTFADCYILTPFPGTEVHEIAVKAGLLEEKKTDYSQWGGWMDYKLIGSTPQQRRKIENLQKLFSIVVKFPFLYPLVPFLASLPLGKVYWSVRVVLYLALVLRFASPIPKKTMLLYSLRSMLGRTSGPVAGRGSRS